jgi:hypothetical protein
MHRGGCACECSSAPTAGAVKCAGATLSVCGLEKRSASGRRRQRRVQPRLDGANAGLELGPAFSVGKKNDGRGPRSRRAPLKKLLQLTLVHSLLSSRHARLERGALVLPPHVRSAPRSAICTLRFDARRLRRSFDLAKPETRFGLSLLPGDRVRCRTASGGS